MCPRRLSVASSGLAVKLLVDSRASHEKAEEKSTNKNKSNGDRMQTETHQAVPFWISAMWVATFPQKLALKMKVAQKFQFCVWVKNKFLIISPAGGP